MLFFDICLKHNWSRLLELNKNYLTTIKFFKSWPYTVQMSLENGQHWQSKKAQMSATLDSVKLLSSVHRDWPSTNPILNRGKEDCFSGMLYCFIWSTFYLQWFTWVQLLHVGLRQHGHSTNLMFHTKPLDVKSWIGGQLYRKDKEAARTQNVLTHTHSSTFCCV